MEVKYYANNMQDALDKVKKELGPDAIVVSSQQVRSRKGLFGFLSPKVYEVVASYDPQTKRNAAKEGSPFQPLSKPNRMQKKNNLDELVEKALEWDQQKQQQEQKKQKDEQKKMAQLDEKIEKLNQMIDQFTDRVESAQKEAPPVEMTPALQKLYENLIASDTDEQVALELIGQTKNILEKRPQTSEMEAMDHVLREFIGEVKEIKHKKFEQEVIMIIGPTGVGKTTTLVKLASHYVTKLGLKVGIINTDVYRVGAQEQLKTYAEILGVPMLTVYNPEELEDAMSAFSDMDMVFIDTAGKVSSDEKYQQEVERMMQLAGVDQVYLAVSGSTQLRNLQELFENYAFLGKYNLIVTKMDEGSRKGVFLNMRKFSGRPLSYETIGQSVPDDIQKTDVAAIISEMLRY